MRSSFSILFFLLFSLPLLSTPTPVTTAGGPSSHSAAVTEDIAEPDNSRAAAEPVGRALRCPPPREKSESADAQLPSGIRSPEGNGVPSLPRTRTNSFESGRACRPATAAELEHPEPSKLQAPSSKLPTTSPPHHLTNDNCTLHIAHCTLNSDLPLSVRQQADTALSSFRTIVSDEMNRVYDLLHTRHPDWNIRRSRGNSRKNDYRNYQWITITIGEEMYIIAFVYNDIDLSTGNMHSQFGRVAFWSDIHYENGRKNEAGPHTKDANGWQFRYDKQWKDMSALYLWAPDYSTERVADLFEAFLESKKYQ